MCYNRNKIKRKEPTVFEFHRIYQSLTASPYKRDDFYIEMEPSADLKPYIRCFWGNRSPIVRQTTEYVSQDLVIPDTSMDIIFDVSFTHHKIRSSFCGINDIAFRTNNIVSKDDVFSTFGIRFYAWSAILFAGESMTEVKNQAYDVGHHFEGIKKEMEPLLFDITSMTERIRIAESILRKELRTNQASLIIAEVINHILKKKGNIDVMELSKEIHISTRQLERLCKFYVGISPKKLASLIRYQYVWNDIAFKKDFHILDAVEKFGYVDQSHLLKDFKKYHLMLPNEAKEFAVKSCRIFTI